MKLSIPQNGHSAVAPSADLPSMPIQYCDPQASWQKPHVENNHTLIRRIIPKGSSFSFLDDHDVHLVTEHINSVPRETFDNRTPFELMSSPEQKKTAGIPEALRDPTRRSASQAGSSEEEIINS